MEPAVVEGIVVADSRCEELNWSYYAVESQSNVDQAVEEKANFDEGAHNSQLNVGCRSWIYVGGCFERDRSDCLSQLILQLFMYLMFRDAPS